MNKAREVVLAAASGLVIGLAVLWLWFSLLSLLDIMLEM